MNGFIYLIFTCLCFLSIYFSSQTCDTAPLYQLGDQCNPFTRYPIPRETLTSFFVCLFLSVKFPNFICLHSLQAIENKDLKIRLIWACENSQIFAWLRVARSRRSHKVTRNRFQPKLDLYILYFVLKFRSIWGDRVLRKTSLRKGTKNDKIDVNRTKIDVSRIEKNFFLKIYFITNRKCC